MIDIKKYPYKLSQDYLFNIDNDGCLLSKNAEIERVANVLSKTIINAEWHPIVAINIIMHNFDYLNKLYINEITEEEYIRKFTIEEQNQNNNDDEYLMLSGWMTVLIYMIHCLAILLDATIEETITVMDEKDIWGNLAVSGSMVNAGWPLDLAERFCLFAYRDVPEEEIFLTMEEIKNRPQVAHHFWK